MLGGIFGGTALIIFIAYACHRWNGKPIKSNADFVNEAPAKPINHEKDPFESGVWSSRYFQNGMFHGPHSMTVRFDRSSSTLTGEGTDDIGSFQVDGVFSMKNSRLGLVKKYQLGTGNPTENFGHHVTIQLSWHEKNHQFEGKWFIQTSKYRGENRFELRFNNSPQNITGQIKY